MQQKNFEENKYNKFYNIFELLLFIFFKRF